MDLRLRPARPDDFADVAAMAEAFHGEEIGPVEAKREAAALVLALGQPAMRCWLVKNGVRTVGYVVVALRFDSEQVRAAAQIEELYLALDLRGRGLIPGVMGEVEQALVSGGCRTLSLDVEVIAAGAYAFYRALGYAVSGEREMSKILVQKRGQTPF